MSKTWKFKQVPIELSVVAQCASVPTLQRDGNSKKRLRNHSEEVQRCRSRRPPPCARVEGAPEEQNRRTQEQIVDVEADDLFVGNSF